MTSARRWLLLAVLLFSALAGLAALVPESTAALDIPIHAAAAQLRDTPLWPVVNAISLVGYPLPWDVAVVALGVAVAVRQRRWRPLVLPAWLFVGEAAAVVAKLLENRPRPAGVTVDDLVTQASFPSGHVTRVAVTVGVALLLAWPALRPSLRVLGVVAAMTAVVLMAVARVAPGEHWPSDVVGAMLLGGAVVAVMGAVLAAGDSRDPGRGT